MSTKIYDAMCHLLDNLCIKLNYFFLLFIGNDFPGISRVTSTSGPVPTRRSNLSNTLPSPRRRQQMKEMLEAKPSSKDDSSGVKPQNVRLDFFFQFIIRILRIQLGLVVLRIIF